MGNMLPKIFEKLTLKLHVFMHFWSM